MLDTSKIHALIARARRRLRLQAALDAAVTSSILAFAAGLATVYAVRRGAIDESTGILLLIACTGIVLVGALIGAMVRLPTYIVATRIDRASNLADRLSSACAFEDRLTRANAANAAGADAPDAPDAETTAFMRAAIRDAVRSLPKADVKAATPFQRPRDLRAASAFACVAALVAGLTWHDDSDASVAITAAELDLAKKPLVPGERPDQFEEEDLEYARDLLENLRRTAQADREPNLERFADEVENLLKQAELGQLSKEKLLEELAKAEERYMQGADEDIEQALADLQETGRELKKEPITRELGQALEQGDLEKAQQEMDKLADKLANNQLSEKDQQKAAKALEKAADKFQNKQDQREQKLDEKIAEQKEQIRRLQRKQEESKNEEEKRRLTRQLDKKKRELKKLERDKQKEQASEQKRTLKSLHRNMKQAAKDMQKQSGDKKENQRNASRRMRHASRDTGKVDADRRKINTQKKVASQLTDLKEAMRRAQRRQGQGMRDLFGKNRKNQDFRRRARGQRGTRQAWKPGQGQGQSGKSGQTGQGQGQGQGQGGQGQQPGGQNYGDSHDPYLMGDPTKKGGNTKDESLTGVHGRGPSVRETILSAAQKGFASRAYEQVYTDYKEVVEEVIRAEKVPSGYKYYVKRYFQKIKPHSMD